MTNLHKLMKEVLSLSKEEYEILTETVREVHNVKRTCTQLGIPYSDEMCVNWIKSTENYRCRNAPVAICPPSSGNINNQPDPFTEKMAKTLTGDNLDIIEEAAIKKGLL